MTQLDIQVEKRCPGAILRQQSELIPNNLFLSFNRRSYSYKDSAQIVHSISSAFQELGINENDAVGIMLPNSSEFVFSWLACSTIGALAVPINPTYKSDLLDYLFKDSGIKGLVIEKSLLPELNLLPIETLQKLEWIAIVGGVDDSVLTKSISKQLDFQHLQNKEPLRKFPNIDFRRPNCVIYTSGTTGPSKGVVLSNAALLAGSLTFIEIVDLKHDDVVLTPLPLFHGIASRQGVFACLIQGAHLVLEERFSASNFWRQVVEARATIAHTMFNIPAMLKAQPISPYERQHNLRAMYNASHDEEFEKRFNVSLLEAYGLIETAITIYSPFSEKKWGSCGKIHREWEARLVDDMDFPVPTGETGELLLRPKSPWLFMDGYLNKPSATLGSLQNLWFHTGDYLRQDHEGFFYFSGRKKERIRRRGENISAWEIEKVVSEHPDVELCAAMGYPSEVGDDDVRLAVQLCHGASVKPSLLMDWLQERLPPFMLPRYIEFHVDLPLTPTKKVQKNKLIDSGLLPTAWDREKAGYSITKK